METELRKICEIGDLQKLVAFFEEHPLFDVNAPLDPSNWTALHTASAYGHTEIVNFLLKMKDIDPNRLTESGDTAIILSIMFMGNIDTNKMLLRDSRVNDVVDKGQTILWYAVKKEDVHLIKWIIILRHKDMMDLEKRGRNWANNKEYTPIEFAEALNRNDIRDLLTRFSRDPVRCRHEVGLDLGITNAKVADLFASLIFLCDNYTSLENELPQTSNPSRFFAIAKKLPMELQMLICHRVYGSAKEIIKSTDSEPAFMALAASFSHQLQLDE